MKVSTVVNNSKHPYFYSVYVLKIHYSVYRIFLFLFCVKIFSIEVLMELHTLYNIIIKFTLLQYIFDDIIRSIDLKTKIGSTSLLV